jgi:hypothetical protein
MNVCVGLGGIPLSILSTKMAFLWTNASTESFNAKENMEGYIFWMSPRSLLNSIFVDAIVSDNNNQVEDP